MALPDRKSRLRISQQFLLTGVNTRTSEAVRAEIRLPRLLPERREGKRLSALSRREKGNKSGAVKASGLLTAVNCREHTEHTWTKSASLNYPG
jgi:hypothetical protein